MFVGRVEVMSSWTEKTIRAAIANDDKQTLGKFGRFLGPFLDQIRATGDITVPSTAWATTIRTPATCIR